MLFSAPARCLAGERGGVRGLFGGAVRRPHRRPEPTQGPAAVPGQQRARAQAEGERARADKGIRSSSRNVRDGGGGGGYGCFSHETFG